MSFAVCPLSVVPIRSSASDKSELVSQILFGEVVEVIEKKGAWRRIRCTWDNYVGWTDVKQIQLISEEEAHAYQTDFAYSLELLQPVMENNHYISIPLGATLPLFDGLRLTIQQRRYQFSGQAVFPNDLRPSVDLILKIARKYLYAPYLWGGRSPLGIDCSGFTQNVFRMVGIALPRDAYQQVTKGELVDFIEQAQAGDLAFFENRTGRITHVGILLPDGEIIHASGWVRIDKIDHYGIFNENTKKYTHQLRVVKRVLDYNVSLPSNENEDTLAENQVTMF